MPLATRVSLAGPEAACVALLRLNRADQVNFFQAAGLQSVVSCNLLDLVHVHRFGLCYVSFG